MKRVDLKKRKKIQLSILCVVIAILFFGGGAAFGSMILSGTKSENPEMAKLNEVYNLIKDRWYYADEVEDLDTRLIEQAITGMTTLEEDLHTNYFTLEQARAFSESLSGSSVGIGVTFYQRPDGNLEVKQVYINSTADQAGLQPGDILVAVDGKETAGSESDEFVSYIKSHDGQQVTVDFLRDNTPMSVTLTPGTFDSTVSAVKMDGYGEVILSSFSEYSGKEFADALARLKADGAKDLILDLRNNTGGYLSSALDIAGSLLPKDAVVFQEEKADGEIKEYRASSQYTQVEFDHIYVLQNANTASAAEVLIGALRDNLGSRVTTIGTTSYGKGTEQVSIPFSDGTSLKVTIAEWKTPDGTSINKTGFEPDVVTEENIVNSTRYTEMDEGEQILPDSVGINAQAAQVFLQYLGYPVDRTDSYFSAASSLALADFQKDQGLEATGILDKETFEKLLNTVVAGINTSSREQDNALQKAIELITQGG